MMRYYLVVSGLLLWCAMVGHNGLAMVMNEKLLNTSASQDFYADALGKAILFFEGQRSGKLPKQRVTWRGDSALSDGKLENVDLSGGYYDAGDNVKFGWTISYSVSLLSWSAIEFRGQIRSVNKQLHHLRNAIRWGTDFILKSHTSPTTLYTQVGDGNGDHQCWERPEDMDTPRTLYKIDANSPGTEAAADAAAALAAASIVFKQSDPNYSSILLAKSKSLFDFADKYRGSYSASCPFYCSYSGYEDELLWAASWLYKASGESKYLDYVLSNQGWSHGVPELSWDNKFVGAQILLTEEFYSGKNQLSKFKGDAESFLCTVMPGSSSVQIKTTPGLLFTRDASNLQYATGSTLALMIFSKILKKNRIDGVQCGSVHFSASQIKTFAKTQVDYILGNNPMSMSYMVGFGSKFPQQLHHRGSSIPSIKDHQPKVGCSEGQSNYYNSPNPNPNIHVGAIVGGPDSNDHFSDARSDYSHSEPTTYINAAFVGSVAALLSRNEQGTTQFSLNDERIVN
ncbi:putative cellulase [Lupinus albus]|uniref:Endoglucanase n=1 Tax=Lupinus albus TaxID=3870 RepID=A0A6A4PY97_LUPAL|nr:putative cellulase [Lupinus albus]